MEEKKASENDLSVESSSNAFPSAEHFPESAESTASAEVEKVTANVNQKDDGNQFLNSVEANVTQNAQRTSKNRSGSAKPSKEKIGSSNRGLIETAAPFESVKEVVTKYGGIVDWKAHKVHTLERDEYVQAELERVQTEISECNRESKAAEIAKIEILKEIENTNRIKEELETKIEKAQTEEAQAKQDLELAQLRAKEIEQGTTVKAQLEVEKARHEAAVAELNSVNEELKKLEEDHATLVEERDSAMRKAEEAVSKSKEVNNTAEELTLQLIAAKESLESAHSSQLKAEELKVSTALAREQDVLAWRTELILAEEKVRSMSQQISLKGDLQLKFEAASSLLQNLNAELASYMQARLKHESACVENNDLEGTDESQHPIERLVLTQRKLEKVKATIEKAEEEVSFLNLAASTLKSELEKKKETVTDIKQQEGMAVTTIRSLAAELDRTKHKLEGTKAKEKEAREKMVDLPKLLQQAAFDADKSKSEVQLAKSVLQNATEELKQVKATARTTETRLSAVLKEVDAVKASERLAVSAIQALHDSEQNAGIQAGDSQSFVSLPFDEYFDLSKKAYEAEELAQEKIASSLAQVEAAKESEAKNIDRLVEAYKEMNGRKEALKLAKEKAEKAKEEKMGVEQELRKLKTEGKIRFKLRDVLKNVVNPIDSPRTSFERNDDTNVFSKHENDVLVHPVHDREFDMSHIGVPNNDVPITSAKGKKRLRFLRVLGLLATDNQKQQSNGHA